MTEGFLYANVAFKLITLFNKFKYVTLLTKITKNLVLMDNKLIFDFT